MPTQGRQGFRKGASSDNPDRVGKGSGQRDKNTIKRLNLYRARAIRDKTGKVIGGQLMMKGRAGDAPITGATGRVQPDRRWFGNTRVVGAKELDTFREEMGKRAHDPYTVILREKRLPMGLLTDTGGQGSSEAAASSSAEQASHAGFRRSGAILSAESFQDTFGKKSKRKRPRLDGMLGGLLGGASDMGALAVAAQAKRQGYSEANRGGAGAGASAKQQGGATAGEGAAAGEGQGQGQGVMSAAEAELLEAAGAASGEEGVGDPRGDGGASSSQGEDIDGVDLADLVARAEAQGRKQVAEGAGDVSGEGGLGELPSGTGAGTQQQGDAGSVGAASLPSTAGAASVAATAGTAGSVAGDLDRQRFATNQAGGAAFKMETRERVLEKGQSRRIWGELFKVLDCSDVVVQVLDARDPMGTRSHRLEKHLRSNARHKHLVLVLNKCDLVPTWVTRRWVQRLSREVPTLAFHASVTRPFGKGALIALLQQFARLHSDKQAISVGFVGFPNVGKSSMINALRGKKACNVAPVPGETKIWQYVTLFKSVLLVDCPGVVPPEQTAHATAQSVILRGVARAEKLEDPEEAAEEAIRRSQRVHLEKTYGVPASSWVDPGDFLRAMARRMGKLKKGGVEDTRIVARVIINDWQRGRLPWFVPPPEEAQVAGGDEEQAAEAGAASAASASASASSSSSSSSASSSSSSASAAATQEAGPQPMSAQAPMQGDSSASATGRIDEDDEASGPQEVPGASGVVVPAQEFDGVGDHWAEGGAQAALVAAAKGGRKGKKGKAKGKAKGRVTRGRKRKADEMEAGSNDD